MLQFVSQRNEWLALPRGRSQRSCILVSSVLRSFVCIQCIHTSCSFCVTSSTRTRRGGSCLRFDDKTFFIYRIYRTCVHRAPCVRALCKLVALLLSENVTGVRPRWHATSGEHFLHMSHCTLHTLHFTLHTCTSHSTVHLISNHLVSSHLMSPCHLIWPLLISSHPFSHVI